MAGESITAWAVFSAIGGSIIGSVTGGVISYWLQKKNIAATKAQRDEDRLEARKALAYSLFIKMGKIFSNLNLLRKTMQQYFEEGKAAGMDEPWTFVKPLASSFDDVQFTSEEMALVLALDAPLFNDLMPWDAIHNGLMDVFELYGRKRADLLDRFPAAMTGMVGRIVLTGNERMAIGPHVAELNHMIAALQKRIINDSEEAWSLNERVFELVKKEFGLNRKLQRKPDQPDDAGKRTV
jgi:hypothetical protein